MTQDSIALMAAVLGLGFVTAALLAWRGGDTRRDLALLGGSGLSLSAVAAVLFAT
jgi:hypothetical protein